MKRILQKNEKILREVAQEVHVHEIKSAKIKKVLKEMSQALRSQHDGVAMAAPQIGYSLRIFIVSGKIFNRDFINDRKKRLSGEAPAEEIKKVKEDSKDIVFFNPKISKLSREKEWMQEGCLSVRPYYGKTYRSKKVILTAHDGNGKKITRGASGLLAQIFQHETDHLNGILFIDHAKEVRKEIPQNK